MKAVIMAGGEGTRLRPVTCGIPKPMVPILNKPVMEYTIHLLKRYGFKDIAVTMAYFPSVITDYFGDGRAWDVNLHYYTEEVPLGTGGSVKNAEDFLDSTFVIVSGDALTDIDLEQAVSFHKSRQSKATLVLKKVAVPLEYGVVITDSEGRILRFLEKPSWGEVFSDTINTGIYILEPEVMDYYKKGDNFDFSKDLFPKLLKDGVPMFGYVSGKYWNDIGDLKVYQEVNFDLLYDRLRIPLEHKQIRESVWVGSNTVIDDSCTVEPPVYIGSNCTIGRNVRLSSVIVGDNTEIKENSSLKKSIIWKNVGIGSNVQCRGTVVCNNVSIKYGVHLFENTVIGNNTVIENGAVVKPDIKIWPEKLIRSDAVVTQNLVWGTKASKTLFGFRDISGDINLDLTPEFASKLGSSYGSILKENAKVIISCDSSRSAAIIKEAILAGVLSTGIEAIDIENAVLPINRYAVKFYKADGGIHVWKDYGEENKIHIELTGKNGISIDRGTERKIENSFVREDFKRCNADRIKNVTRIYNFNEFYIQNGANLLRNLNQIKNKAMKVVVGSKSEQILNLAASYLKNIGCVVEEDYLAKSRKSIKELPNPAVYRQHIAEMVVKLGAGIGFVFSENGENVTLIDHKGRILDADKYLGLTSLIILKTGADNKLVIPYTASRMIEEMADHYHIKVVRTKNSPSDLMQAMQAENGGMDQSIFQYILNFDAIWGVGSLLDFIAENNVYLYDLVNELPHIHIEKKEVFCDWKHKGQVIREIIEENKDKEIELFEGVRINNDSGWVLVLPDSEKPVCNIYAEGASEEFARELAADFIDRIKSILSKAED